MRKLFKWLDKHIIQTLLIGYIFFIPLYPKLPFKMINYTYIAVRLEDFYVAILFAVFFLQVVRKKIQLHRKLLVPVLLFWLAMMFSFIWGFIIQKTIVFSHLGLLHIFRRVEYMTVFFVFASSIRSKSDFLFYIRLVILAVGMVGLYGIGQKFLGWPAVQTMNPEYAKGYLLVLDANARISSTFGGHYDLAAYLVFLIPMVLGAFFYFQKKAWYFFVLVVSIFTLTLTASRVSYGAYIMSTFPFLLFSKKFRMFFIVIFLTAGLTLASGNLTKRLTRTFQQKQIFIDKSTGQTTVPRVLRPDDLPVGDFVINKNARVKKASDVNKAILNTRDTEEVKASIRDEIRRKATAEGRKLTKAEEERLVEEAFKNLKVVSAILPDISLATRLQVEWPRAIIAFLKYPIFGKGPSTITEATDNDYLRWLGEFGIAGTTIFIFILGYLGLMLFKQDKLKKYPEQILFRAALFGYAGILINATYIDVFEASKIAYHFWMVMGIFIAFSDLPKSKQKNNL